LELGIQEWVEGRIIELDCSEDEYGLSGSIPESIGYLTELTRLELGDNQLVGNIPESIGSLVNLIKLGLDNNLLTGLIIT
jgi:Leucine-rich repeat (LRR) protein